MLNEPLSALELKNLLRAILDNPGALRYSKHALDEMAKDSIIKPEIHSALRAGQMTEPPEMENGTWRYRIRTQKLVIVVALRSEAIATVITAWKLRR